METPVAPTLRERMAVNVWQAVNTETSERFMSPVYPVLLGESPAAFEGIMSSVPLMFPPSLEGVLASPSPPSLAFLRSLPDAGTKTWGVYSVLLKKEGCPPLAYTGSGTNARNGVRQRLQDYDNERNLPQKIADALKKGYVITNRGLLCWARIPKAALIPTARVFFIALEAVISFMFSTGVKTKYDHLFASFIPWAREQVEWLPLCTHTSFMENRTGGSTLSAEQLEEYSAIMKQRACDRARESEAKQRAEDLEGFLAKKTAGQKAIRATEVGKAKMTIHRLDARARNMASEQFKCFPCNHVSGNQKEFDKHNDSQDHRRAVGLPLKTDRHTATSDRAQRARAREEWHRQHKSFYCKPCNQAFGVRGKLKRHIDKIHDGVAPDEASASVEEADDES